MSRTVTPRMRAMVRKLRKSGWSIDDTAEHVGVSRRCVVQETGDAPHITRQHDDWDRHQKYYPPPERLETEYRRCAQCGGKYSGGFCFKCYSASLPDERGSCPPEHIESSSEASGRRSPAVLRGPGTVGECILRAKEFEIGEHARRAMVWETKGRNRMGWLKVKGGRQRNIKPVARPPDYDSMLEASMPTLVAVRDRESQKADYVSRSGVYANWLEDCAQETGLPAVEIAVLAIRHEIDVTGFDPMLVATAVDLDRHLISSPAKMRLAR